MKNLKLTLSDEEYDRIREAAGYEPLASWAKRVIFSGLKSSPKQRKEVVPSAPANCSGNSAEAGGSASGEKTREEFYDMHAARHTGHAMGHDCPACNRARATLGKK